MPAAKQPTQVTPAASAQMPASGRAIRDEALPAWINHPEVLAERRWPPVSLARGVSLGQPLPPQPD